MKIVEPSVELIQENNPFKMIEIVGRTCYKSNSEYTEESGRKFFDQLKSAGHFAMIEHANIVFEVYEEVYQRINVRVKEIGAFGEPSEFVTNFLNLTEVEISPAYTRYLVSGNIRAINDFGDPDLLNALRREDTQLMYKGDVSDSLLPFGAVVVRNPKRLTPVEKRIHTYFSFKFVCDRGVTHEIVRHRPASFGQESTRYCNYAKEKYCAEIAYIRPFFFEEGSPEYMCWFNTCLSAELNYMDLVNNHNRTPQEARALLPNSLKTEIVMTANVEEFIHFFNLRYFGTTGKPHPQIHQVAEMAIKLFVDEEGNNFHPDYK